jgi:putative ABC transport system substrate-binding protein
MAIGIGRRQFISALGGGAFAWPLTARAQQPTMPVVGFLNGSTADSIAGRSVAAAFRKGLNEAGYVEGKNVAIEYQWADGHYDRFPALAAELVSRQVNAMFVSGGSVAPRAAMNATTTIPIVFSIGSDPVKFGFVQSLNRPGGNVTGVSFLINALGTKRLDLLHELVPAARAFGFLVNQKNPSAEAETGEMKQAADALGGTLIVIEASTDDEIDAAFASFIEHRIAGLAVAADAFFSSRADRLAVLAAKNRIPTIYSLREYTDAGGLMSYGASLSDASRQAGLLTGRILKGQKPADLPVMQSTKYEFVINLKTAKALNIAIPSGVLAIADDVIE